MPYEVAIATLDGRAYYALSKLLKEVGLAYEAFVPGQKLDSRIGLVITTKKERDLIEHHNVVCLEDLGVDGKDMQEKILGLLYGGKDSTFVVGIDPGERIGLAAYYPRSELDVGVFESTEKAIDRVERLIWNANAAKKIVRLGYGKPDVAREIVRQLRKRALEASIELVDERGTSSFARGSKGKGTKDERSAWMIALRRGRKVG